MSKSDGRLSILLNALFSLPMVATFAVHTEIPVSFIQVAAVPTIPLFPSICAVSLAPPSIRPNDRE